MRAAAEGQLCDYAVKSSYSNFLLGSLLQFKQVIFH